MRSLILIVITLAILGGGFALYAWLQPPAPKKPVRALDANATNVPRPQLDATLHGVGSGEDVWVKKYDPKTGELASQFKAQKYDPQKDGTVNTVMPQAEFFNGNGKQRIRVEGVTGNVLMQLAPEDKTAKLGGRGEQATMPSRGKLQDVVISIFEPADSADPNLVARMNNAAFDTDTFRINTEAFVDPATAKTVAGDEVPVTVRGKDYDFDGRGLIVRWNERDRKLQLLEVEHGESLVIKNPDALSKSGLSVTPTTAPSVAPATQPLTSAPTSMMLASVDPRAAVSIIPVAKSPAKSRARGGAAAKHPAHPSPAPATTNAATRKSKIVRDESPVVYRATFEKDVRIFQADEQVAQAETMHVDLLQESKQNQAAGTTRPATEPAAVAAETTKPVKHEARKRPATTTSAPADEATGEKTATTRPSGPVIIKWVGKLRVEPIEPAEDETLVPGKAIVHMIGAPVVLTSKGTRATCGTASFNSADESASLLASDVVPIVTMTDARGMKVTTPELDYSPAPSPREHFATLIGDSQAEFPITDDSGKQQTATASWSDECRLTMLNTGTDESSAVVRHADITGDVAVDHPQLKLTSDALALNFDEKPPTTRHATTSLAAATRGTASPATTRAAGSTESMGDTLRDVVATGNVHCKMLDSQDPTQQRTIDTQRLRVVRGNDEAGKAYAKLIEADGDVKTSDGASTLQSQHFAAELAPMPATTQSSTQPSTQPTALVATTQPATSRAAASTRNSSSNFAGDNVKLVAMHASDNVVLTSNNGSKASAEHLSADTVQGKLSYRLTGSPNATVTDDKTTIVGPVIRFTPDDNLAEIIGVGSMNGVDPKDPKQTINIAWTGGATINGTTDWVDVDKDVVMTARQADGTINGATARHLRAKLEPRPPSTNPASRPSTQVAAVATRPATTRVASTKPVRSDQTTSFMKDKDITRATLKGSVEVKSEQKNADGSLARAINLFGETVNYDRATGQFDVPVEGKMLYQDHRAGGADNGPEGPTVGGGRGATAFAWKKNLVYLPDGKRVVMNGDVQVVHKPDANGGQPFNMNAQQMTAELEPDPAATTKATTKATTNPTDATQKMRLKRVMADGDVHVTSTRMDVDAVHLDYDPIGQILTATGEGRTPVTVFDHQKGTSTQIQELWWNTKTDQFKMRDLTGKVR